MKKYPFKFLDSYAKEDQDIFFGRDEEIEALYRLVFQANLMLVYGGSGTGKTSLIRCGLANRFKTSQWKDLYIRRGGDINQSLLDTVIKNTPARKTAGVSAGEEEEEDWFESILESEEEAGNTEVERLQLQTDNPVAHALQALYLATFTPIYLIFDQFEELYTLGNAEEQRQFTNTIAELVTLPLPIKIIIVMREEYLARLYNLEMAVPQLRNKKLRIEPMDLPRVEQVLLSATARNPQSNISLESGKEQEIARAIIDKVREGDVYVKLPYLQVFMDRLYEKATGEAVDRQSEAHFSPALVNEMGNIGDVLKDFIELQSSRLQRKLSQKYKDLPTDIVWHILSPFATVDGTKVPIRQSELPQIKQALTLTDTRRADELIKETVVELENSRILRYRKEEDTYEVAHDTLALQIAEKRSEEEKTYLKARRMVTEGYTTFQDTETYLNRKQLAFIRPYEERLEAEMEVAQQAFIRESEQQVRKSERRRRLIIAGIGMVLLLAAGVSIWFGLDAIAAQKRSDSLAIAAQEALSSLQTATAKIVLDVLTDAEVDIYHLRYEEALSKYKNAQETGLNAGARLIWIKGMMELTYFYNEAGRADPAGKAKAYRLARELAEEANVNGLLNSTVSIAGLLERLDGLWYDTLSSRYYPQMIEVAGNAEVADFELGRTEVTMWEYYLYCESSKEDRIERIRPKVGWGVDGDNPAVYVSWYDAARYANWMSKRTGLDTVYVFDSEGRIDSIRTEIPNCYRLPKEEEWKYAAGGGPNQQGFTFSGSDNVNHVGWTYSNSSFRTHPVAQLAPTHKDDLELYDMSGNVWEWCEDKYYNKDNNNPTDRVLRGGAYDKFANISKVSNRMPGTVSSGFVYAGFRLARSGGQ